ncbi:hypothetical protein H5T87_11450, partial [bacterium]|nr:hypothetical protein [bacterium]
FITPDFKYALTLYPDYSDIEAVYESIDISYTERWLPDKRPFFTEGSEYFGPLYSRRIDKFDLGLKAFGQAGKSQIGFLNCIRFDSFRNDTVLNYNYNFTHQYSMGVMLQSRYEKSHRNILIAGGGGGGTSNFGYGVSYAISLTEPGKDGFLYNLSMWQRVGERGGFFANYTALSPDFWADLQLIDITGVKATNIGFYYSGVSPRGKKWWESYVWEMSYGRANYWSGGCKAENKGGSFSIGLRGDISLGISRNISFFEPFRDHFTTISFGIGSPEKKYFFSSSYGKGIRTNSPYKFASGGIWRQLLKDKLNIGLNFEKRWVGVGSGWFSAQQIWGSISYDIGKDFWIVIRLYQLQDTDKHHNISAVIRRKGERKGDFYFVLGDPLGTDFKERMAIKYIMPW